MDNGIDQVEIELRDKVGAGGVLNAMDGPQAGSLSLFWVEGIGDCGFRVKGGVVWGGMIGGKGDVVCRVPVLCGDAEGKGQGQEVVDDWGYCTTIRDC